MTNHQKILHELLQRSGLSKTNYCKKHSIQPVRLSQWLSGNRNIKFGTLQQFAQNDGLEIELMYKIKEK